MTAHLHAVPDQGAVICLTAREARAAASMIGIAITANIALCNARDAGWLPAEVAQDIDGLDRDRAVALLGLAGRLYEAADDPEGVATTARTAEALTRAAQPSGGDPEPEAASDPYDGLTRPQELAADRVMSEYGRAVVTPRRDGTVEVTALLGDNPVYTVSLDGDGTERWRRNA